VLILRLTTNSASASNLKLNYMKLLIIPSIMFQTNTKIRKLQVIYLLSISLITRRLKTINAFKRSGQSSSQVHDLFVCGNLTNNGASGRNNYYLFVDYFATLPVSRLHSVGW
jgi:hypothetical protein